MDFDTEVDLLMNGLHAPEPQRSGTLVRLVGMRLETRGLMAPLGACCEVTGQFGHSVQAEVVGFNDETLYLLPFNEPHGIGPGSAGARTARPHHRRQR
jgi:flagellum-specific ATP synthase